MINDFVVVNSFCLLGLTINNKGTERQEIGCRLALNSTTIKTWKIYSDDVDVSIPTKNRIRQAMNGFPCHCGPFLYHYEIGL